MKKDKPEIEQTRITTNGNKIVSYNATKIVKDFGAGSAHIVVPVKLVGKVVTITYFQEPKKKEAK